MKMNFFEFDEEKRLCKIQELQARTGVVVECTPEYAIQKLREDLLTLKEFKQKEIKLG